MTDEFLRLIQDRLLFNEGFRSKPYFCIKGKQTIGIGRNLDANPITPEEEKVIGAKWISEGITKNGALYLLRNDIEKVLKQLNKELPWWNTMNQDRQYVMIDLCFQLGINGLLKFKKTLNYLMDSEYKLASDELLNSNYAKQTPKRAKRNSDCIKCGKYII